MPEQNKLSRLANALVPGHTVPTMLMLLYAIPAAFGVYSFRDRYALLVALCLGVSIGFYYVGYYGAGRIAWIGGGRPLLPATILTPKAWKVAAIAALVVYAALVVFLAVTAKHVALFLALGFGDASQVARARDEFVQNRVGWEAILRYLNAILFRVVVPSIVVTLYLKHHRWRHALLAAALFCALLTLEKSLTAFILVPLAVAFLIGNRTQGLKALGFAAVFVLVATALAAGFIGVLAGRESHRHELLVTDLRGDRKNLFWVIDSPPGDKLQQAIARYRSKFNTTPNGMLAPPPKATDEQATEAANAAQEETISRKFGRLGGPNRSGGKGFEGIAQTISENESSASNVDLHRPYPASPGEGAPALSPDQWTSLGLRNRIINGGMEIEQPGDDESTDRDENGPMPSRWNSVVSIPGKLVERIVSDAPRGFERAVQFSTVSAWIPRWGEAFELEQRVEGYKVKDLAFGTGSAEAITLSFWAKATISGRYNATIVNGLWTRSYLTTYTVSHANTWEHEIVTIPGDRNGLPSMWPQGTERSLVVSFNLGAGRPYQTSRVETWQNGFFRQSPDTIALVSHPSAALEITGVQLERGETAMPFEYRPLTLEKQLIRHYIPPTKFQQLLKVIAVRVLPRTLASPIATELDAESTTLIFEKTVRQTKFMVNRVAWIPYITAYDWFRFQHDVLHGRYLDGRTIGPVASLLGGQRYPAEHEIFKYEYGYAATPTGTSNAVYFADAYLNFGWLGVVIYSLAIGFIFRVIASCSNAAVAGVSVMSTFGLMVASLSANVLSGGLGLLVLLALLLRHGDVNTRAEGTRQARSKGPGACIDRESA